MPPAKERQRGKASNVDADVSSPSNVQANYPRKLTAVACIDCRKRKRKCNGERPSCSACGTRGLTCTYDVVEGATRTEDLKQRVHLLSSRVQDLEVFVDKLRYSTDNEASAVLAQLRLGDSVGAILQSSDNSEEPASTADLEQWRGQRRPSAESSAQTSHASAGGGGRGPALNTRGTSMLLDTTQRRISDDSIMSMSTNSPNTLYGQEAGVVHMEWATSPWATSLFVEYDLQHVLFDDHAWSDPQTATQDPYSTFGTGYSSSATGFMLGTTRNSAWNTPEPASIRSNSIASEKQSRFSDKRWARQDMLSETNNDPQQTTISSHFFNGIGNIPLSNPIEAQSLTQDLTAPAWSIMSMYRVDDEIDMMSSVYISFIQENRRLILNGVPPEQLFGSMPDVEALLSKAAFDQASVLSQWMARLANSFNIPTTVSRVAVMWLQWYLMRWFIHPTPTTYAEIPEWYRPTPYQMFVQHPIYADFIVWPRLRDAAIQRIDLQREPKYWFSESARTIDCNWNGTLQDAIAYNGSGNLTMVPAFLSHILDLNNWTVGPVIRKHVPDADTLLQIKYGPI